MLSTLFRRVTLRQILWTGCLVTLLYALLSRGVYHSDEHYQILEYAHMKLFGTPAEEHLAWEYPLQMRSGVQPFMAWCVGRVLVAMGCWSPWLAVSILQLLSGLLSVGVLLLFYRTVRDELTSETQRKWFLVLGFFLWFMAYLHVHFSAEMLSGNLFLLLASLTIRYSRRLECGAFDARADRRREFAWGVLLGAVAGATFIVRFQTGFALLGYGIWLLFFSRRWRLYAGMVPGVVVMLALGLLADRWLYGEWTCAPWNYLQENILNARMDQFRHEPWWYYLTAPVLEGGIFFGLLALLATLRFFWRHPRHVVTWMLVPFLLVHFFLAHKEIRFFFPALFFVPWFLVDLFRGRGEVVALNLAEETTYCSRMQHFSGEPRVTEARFYLPRNLDLRHCATSAELEAAAQQLTAAGRQALILSADSGLADHSPLTLRKINWSPYPAWVVRYFNFNDWTRYAVRSKNAYEMVESPVDSADRESGRR